MGKSQEGGQISTHSTVGYNERVTRRRPGSFHSELFTDLSEN